jgi:hypothetical protein
MRKKSMSPLLGTMDQLKQGWDAFSMRMTGQLVPAGT